MHGKKGKKGHFPQATLFNTANLARVEFTSAPRPSLPLSAVVAVIVMANSVRRTFLGDALGWCKAQFVFSMKIEKEREREID